MLLSSCLQNSRFFKISIYAETAALSPPPTRLGARLLIKEGYFLSVKVTFCPPDENNLHEHEVDIALYMVIRKIRICVNICSCDSRFF